MSIFRAYDIRGIYGETLGPLDAFKISYAFSNYIVRSGQIFVGMDNRPNSLPLLLASLAGITAAGIDAIDLGVVPTPLLYFGVAHHKAKGGIMITASHNPPEYNGLKLVKEMAIPLTYETGISDIERIVAKFCSEKLKPNTGSLRKLDITGEYVNYITRDSKVSKELKVVFEAGNGTAGPILRKIVGKLGLDAQILNENPDGSFPFGMVNPAKEETMSRLRQKVKESGADIGIALDVDGDRIGIISRDGRYIPGDFIVAILSLPILKERMGASILLDVRASLSVVDFINANGGNVKFTKVGHSYISNTMAEGDFPLGGEISGHIYFKDRYYGFDDGIYCSLRVLELISMEGSLEELMSRFRRTSISPEIRIPAPDSEKFAIVKRIENELRRKGVKMDLTDGVKATMDTGWFSLRASNTEPALVIRAEAETDQELEKIIRNVMLLIDSSRSA